MVFPRLTPWAKFLRLCRGWESAPAAKEHFSPRSQVALGNALVCEVALRPGDADKEAQLPEQVRSQVQLGNEGERENEKENSRFSSILFFLCGFAPLREVFPPSFRSENRYPLQNL